MHTKDAELSLSCMALVTYTPSHATHRASSHGHTHIDPHSALVFIMHLNLSKLRSTQNSHIHSSTQASAFTLP